jgi:TolA-binding protein
MKKVIILALLSLYAIAAGAQPVKESTKLKKDTFGVYRERTIISKEYVRDTSIIVDQIRRIQVEIDTLQSRLKRLRQDLKDWKKANDGPVTPGSAPRSEDNAPADKPVKVAPQNPAANQPPAKPKSKSKKKNK